jgi:hypothetical protein
VPDSHARRPELLVAAALAAAVSGLWCLAVPLAAPACCDALQYVTMAADPSRPVPTPYSFRALPSRLAHLLAAGTGTGVVGTFHLLSLACLVAAGPVVYLLGRRLGAGHLAALVAMAALLSARGWLYYLTSPYMPDPAAFLLLALAFLALLGLPRARARWLLVAVSVVMAGVREVFVGLVLPAYALTRRRSRHVDWRAAAVAAALLVPAWLAYQLIVRFAPSTGVPQLGRLNAHTVAEIWDLRVRGVNAAGARTATVWWVSIAHTFAMSLGIWWLLAASAWRDRRVRALALWLPVVFANLLFGGDWSRFALYAFPVVIPAGALAIARAAPARRAPLLVLAGLQALAPLADVLAHAPNLNRPGPSLWLTLGLMAVTAVVLWSPGAWWSGLAHRGRPGGGLGHGVEVAAGPGLDGGDDGALDHGRLGDPGPGPDVAVDQVLDRHRG